MTRPHHDSFIPLHQQSQYPRARINALNSWPQLSILYLVNTHYVLNTHYVSGAVWVWKRAVNKQCPSASALSIGPWNPDPLPTQPVQTCNQNTGLKTTGHCRTIIFSYSSTKSGELLLKSFIFIGRVNGLHNPNLYLRSIYFVPGSRLSPSHLSFLIFFNPKR